jgi:Flp pilus assembly protein TadG
MRNRIRHLRRDERGMTMAFVALGFMAFLTATTLAIDVGMFMSARSQAQNAADAGALSGAVALAFNDFDNRNAGGPAVSAAISAAQSNVMVGEAPSVLPADVTFPTTRPASRRGSEWPSTATQSA